MLYTQHYNNFCVACLVQCNAISLQHSEMNNVGGRVTNSKSVSWYCSSVDHFKQAYLLEAEDANCCLEQTLSTAASQGQASLSEAYHLRQREEVKVPH